jgi:hypothetical protein
MPGFTCTSMILVFNIDTISAPGGTPSTLVSLIGQNAYKRCARDVYYFLQVSNLTTPFKVARMPVLHCSPKRTGI